jgi:hypothetical protein
MLLGRVLARHWVHHNPDGPRRSQKDPSTSSRPVSDTDGKAEDVPGRY